MLGMQRAVSVIFPDHCILCPELVETSGGLCASCWKTMAFVQGVSCAGCGLALPGDSDGVEAFCDACLNAPPLWHAGRAALAYKDGSRRFVLALKHGDRPELAIPASDWLYGVAADWDLPNKLLVRFPCIGDACSSAVTTSRLNLPGLWRRARDPTLRRKPCFETGIHRRRMRLIETDGLPMSKAPFWRIPNMEMY